MIRRSEALHPADEASRAAAAAARWAFASGRDEADVLSESIAAARGTLEPSTNPLAEIVAKWIGGDVAKRVLERVRR